MSAKKVHVAFEREVVVLPLSSLLLLRRPPDRIEESSKYKRIASSIEEVGIIEPLVVSRSPDVKDQYLLLDGYLRYRVLSDKGVEEVRCLVSDEDEGFTYNKRISGLAPIQEHFMIVRALGRGASEERLAKALNVDVGLIKRRAVMLDGICPEVVDMLKDRSLSRATFDVLRKMRPMRQIEVAELLTTASNYTHRYCRALLAATKQVDLVKSDRPKKIAGLTAEQMARMEKEMSSLQRDFKEVEASYGDDVLHLVVASGYLTKLTGNTEISAYLAEHHEDLLTELKTIIAATSLDQSASGA